MQESPHKYRHIRMTQKLSAEHEIKKDILLSLEAWDDNFDFYSLDLSDTQKIDDAYNSISPATAHLEDEIQNSTYEFRDSFSEETNIECEWSRHYESKSVAKRLSNGKWVGYTYWYGGGKHGEPSSIDWMEDSYFLDCKEEQKVMTVRTFSKQD